MLAGARRFVHFRWSQLIEDGDEGGAERGDDEGTGGDGYLKPNDPGCALRFADGGFGRFLLHGRPSR